MKWLIAMLLLLVPAIANAQIAGLIQYDGTGQPLTPYQPVTYFSWLAPNATLPNEAVCAAEIAYTPPSTINNSPIDTLNPSANADVPTSLQLAPFYANPNGNAGTTFTLYGGVTGKYAGYLQSTTPPTTDMIIRWAACKWGIDEDTLRAQAWTESTWNANAAGGNQVGAGVQCTGTPITVSPAIYNTSITLLNGSVITNLGGCYDTWGFAQERVTASSPTAYPLIRDSTAFAMDFRAASTRACINGQQVSYFQSNGTCNTPQPGHSTCSTATGLDLDNGCVAAHFSGAWWNAGSVNYFNMVQGFINTKPWPGGRG